MKFLIADTVYPGYVDWLYGENPELGQASYAEQYAATVAGGFHTASAWTEPLERAGHEVLDIWANHLPLQMRWCQENDAVNTLIFAADGYKFGETILANSKPHPWYVDMVAEQLRRYKPDVLLLANIYAFDAAFLQANREHYGVAIGQHAATIPRNDLTGYDLIISSLPNQVKHFRSLGLRSELVKLAFDKRLLERVEKRAPQYDLMFAGQVSPLHTKRSELLLALGRKIQLDLFGDVGWTDEESAGTRLRIHPALWGLPMYQGLSDARIVFNSHIDAAGNFANNLRLYEVTGVGSLLLTDLKDNLAEMFEPGKECVAYKGVDDCVELARHYLANEKERAAIAAAGQKRVLAEHTYDHRVGELLRLVDELVKR